MQHSAAVQCRAVQCRAVYINTGQFSAVQCCLVQIPSKIISVCLTLGASRKKAGFFGSKILTVINLF